MKPCMCCEVTLVRVRAACNSCALQMCEVDQLAAADAVFAVAWSPAQEGLVATGGGDDRAFLWQVGRRADKQQSFSHGDIACWRLSLLATGHAGGRGAGLGRERACRSQRLGEQRPAHACGIATPLYRRAKLSRCAEQVASLAFNTAGTLLASGGLDGVVQGALLLVISAHLGLALSSDARSSAGRVNVWDTSSGRCLHCLEGPGDAVEWLAWHPRGDVLLAGSEDFTAWMWNASLGTCMQACAASLMPLTCHL